MTEQEREDHHAHPYTVRYQLGTDTNSHRGRVRGQQPSYFVWRQLWGMLAGWMTIKYLHIVEGWVFGDVLRG